ncbi:hypothetical protein NKH53_25845, partial [Mesorhizobium australicum]|uniref:hypothetical protein n=1 Tax=Mesorhizobium australicum TaxID=536018 RepID=UPI00333A63BB
MMPVASVELGMLPRREWEMLQSMTEKTSFAEWRSICDFVLTGQSASDAVDARETELGRRLMEIPGVGPLLASAFVATVA